jgi:hypothetical protein
MITKILANFDPINSIKVGSFKTGVKGCLLKIQKLFDDLEWNEKNFDLGTAITQKH